MATIRAGDTVVEQADRIAALTERTPDLEQLVLALATQIEALK
jgi:hypothetical protein